MDRVFLDANVLFSAAYRRGSALARVWDLPRVRLMTSAYALSEARRNLDDPESRGRLDGLAARLAVVGEAPEPRDVPVFLPPEDRPILAAAIAARASHLLTGDRRHFGPYFGRRIEGVLVLTPGDYLREIDPDD